MLGEHQYAAVCRAFGFGLPSGVKLFGPRSGLPEHTADRVLPYYEQHIQPQILAGKNILIAAHGNSLRALVMQLDKLSREAVLELNIPTGAPLLYEFDRDGVVVNHRYL